MIDPTRALFYDFEISEEGLPSIVTWEAQLMNDKNNPKNRFWSAIGEHIKKEITSSFELSEEVNLLRVNDHYAISEVIVTPFDVKVKSPLLKARLALLSSRHRLLCKLYDDKAIDTNGVHSIVRYISYVDVTSGVIYLRSIQTDRYSEELESQLISEGYQSIESSFLFDRLGELNDDSKSIKVEGEFNNRNR